MKTNTTSTPVPASAPSVHGLVGEAREEMIASFERLCLLAGIESLTEMMDEDVEALAGRRHGHCTDRPGYRWGRTRARVGLHGGRIDVDRPRVRHKATGREMALPSWEDISSGGFLDRWAVNLMVMNVATRGFRRAVRLPEAGVPAGAGSSTSG